VASVASAVVSYLDGIESDPAQLLDSGQTSEGSAGCYYADSSEGAGRWIGSGARFRGLAGVVVRESFQRVLEGRHPRTGERLLTARGSSQRSQLAIRTAARLDGDGQALYSVAGVARLLGVIRSEVDELVIAAHKVALGTDRLVLRPRHYRLEDPMNLNDQPRCAESA
jgi:hypothetical protein